MVDNPRNALFYFVFVVFFSLNRFDPAYGINYYGYFRQFLIGFVAIFCLFGASYLKRFIIPKQFFYVYLLVLLIYVYTALIGIEYLPEYLYSFTVDIIICIFLAVIFNFLRSYDVSKKLIIFIFILSVINSIISIIGYFNGAIFSRIDGFDYDMFSFGYSFFGNPVNTSSLIALVLGLTFNLDFRRWLGNRKGIILNISKVILFYHLFLTQRRAGVIYLAMLMLGSLICRRRAIEKVMALLIPVVLFIIAISTPRYTRYQTLLDKQSLSNDIRYISAINGLSVAVENVFLPYGISNIYERVYESERYYSETFYFNKNLIDKNGRILLIQAHSIYEWLLLEYGIIYLLIFIVALAHWTFRNFKSMKIDKDFGNYFILSIMTSTIFLFDPFLINQMKLSLIFLIIISINLVDLKRLKTKQLENQEYKMLPKNKRGQ